jgi:hypothetical protein
MSSSFIGAMSHDYSQLDNIDNTDNPYNALRYKPPAPAADLPHASHLAWNLLT